MLTMRLIGVRDYNVTLIRIKAGLDPTLMLPKGGNRQIDEQLAATEN